MSKVHKADLSFLTYSQLSSLTGISYRVIKKRLSDARIEPSHKTGNAAFFDPIRALPFIYEIEKKDPAGEVLNLGNEQAKLAKARTEKTLMEMEVLKGNLLELDRVASEWGNVVANMRAKLVVLGASLSQKLINRKKRAEIQAIIDDGIYNALEELSVEFKSRAETIISDNSGGSETSSEVDGEPMGGRKKGTKSRGKRGAGTVAD